MPKLSQSDGKTSAFAPAYAAQAPTLSIARQADDHAPAQAGDLVADDTFLGVGARAEQHQGQRARGDLRQSRRGTDQAVQVLPTLEVGD